MFTLNICFEMLSIISECIVFTFGVQLGSTECLLKME